MEDIKKVTLHKALTCNLEESAKEISKKLKENKERRIFVLDARGLLKGIITTTDLVYKVLGEGNLELKAETIMNAPVKAVDISEDLNKALEIMNELKIFFCPVTENGKLLGIISYQDLVGHVISSIEK